MEIFRNKKITILLALSFVLLAGMLIYVLIGHNDHVRNGHEVMKKSQQAVIRLRYYSELMEFARFRDQIMYELISAQDVVAKKELAKQFESYAARFSRTYSLLKNVEHTDFDKRLLDEQQDIIEQVTPRFRELIDKTIANEIAPDHAHEILFSIILTEQGRVIDIFRELVAHQQENIEETVMQTVESQLLDMQTRNYLIVLIFLVTLFLAYLVFRKIYKIENENEEADQYLAKLVDVKNEFAETSEAIEQSWPALKVLVVDDDGLILEQLKTYFDDLGIISYQFESTVTSAMSNMVQQQHSYDLVMTDLNMPNVDGVTFMRFLSKVEYKGSLMIISGEDRRLLKSVVQLANAHGLNILGALEKPFNKSEFRQMLDKIATVISEKPNFIVDKPLSEEEINEGLSSGRLELLYQPKIDVSSMSVSSFEALSIWRMDNGNILGPDLFISVAEQSALINDLSDQVFLKAVRQLSSWHQQGHKYSVAVNFPMCSLERISLPDTLSAICSEANISPAFVTIEVTETAIINQEAIALDVISRLHLKGFRLSIDDFGTGYSSIDQLNKLPFSEIKIDRSFVDGAANSDSSRAILVSSVEMGKRMGISIVSEGVENQQDFNLLKEIGSDYVQGYLFSRPLPAADVLNWVKQWEQSAH
jgi:EAL domain-containing protein (putative c-di-GMP-specific phosphodiesterase class I)/CheY-like chemotaxis protein